MIPLNTPAILERIIRTITIPVEVPPLQVLHTVELNLACDSTARELGAPYSPPMVTVGTPLVAELVIRHSRTWDPHPPARDAPVLSFFYEVQNNPDTWLVSGRKRAHFVGEHGAVGRFPLILVPAKAGYLQLPNIEVKCVDGGDEVGCETEYKAGAGVVLVLPDVRSTTVRIGNAHADGV